MAWEKLDTRDIHSVKYYPAKEILKAHLKSGHFEVYGRISEARYQELLAGRHPHDIDMFFMNMIKPSIVSTHVTLNARMRRVARFVSIAVPAVAVIVLLGLWNAGVVGTWLAKTFPG